MKAPMYHDGKKLQYEETFRTVNASPTEELAIKALNNIRATHSYKDGWIELAAWTEKTPQGFIAVRHHAQYK
ncbi:MAG: hypothetical protein ACI4UU_00440 [Clostridia bacterium]